MVQTTPIRLLDWHLLHPGLGRLIYPGHPEQNPVRPGWGWEACWVSNQLAEDPPRTITLMEGQLTVWALGQIVKAPKPADLFRKALQRMMGAAIVVDGGLTPPPVPVNLALLIMTRDTPRPNAPDSAWIGYRHHLSSARPRAIRLPMEALDWEGVGSVAWSDVWQPLMQTLWSDASKGEGAGS
jgi:hypothetical protein